MEIAKEKKWIQLNLHPSLKEYSSSGRVLATKLLEKEDVGTWLLRAADPEEPSCVVTVSSKIEDDVKNHRIWVENGKFWVKKDELFPTVLEVLNKSSFLTHLADPLYPLKSVDEKKKPIITNEKKEPEEPNYDDEGKPKQKKPIYTDEKEKLEGPNYDDEGKPKQKHPIYTDEEKSKSKYSDYDDEKVSPLRKSKSKSYMDDDEKVSPLPKSSKSKSGSSSLSKSSDAKTKGKSTTIKKTPKNTTPKSPTSKTDTKNTKPVKSGKRETYVVLVMCGDKNKKISIDASSVDDIVVAIGKEYSLKNSFRVEYFDDDFKEYVELTDLGSLKNKTGKLRIVVEQQSEWQFSLKFLEHKNWQEHGSELTPYRSILLKDQSVIVDPMEYKKLESILEKYNAPKDINITKVFAVQNDGLEKAFIFHFQSLQEKFRSSPGLFMKDNWKREKFSDSRMWTYEQFKKKADKFDWSHNPDVPILPVFHGTGKDTPWKIIQTGFTTIATVDDGFYGRGIYFTTSFDYSIFYSKMANKGSNMAYILVAFVIPGNPYPVIESPTATPSFKGKGLADPSGYQSHYVCVNPKGSSSPLGFPCPPKSDKFYDEIVVFQDYQVVPKYLLEVNASNY